MAFKPISMHQIRQLIGFLSKGYTISETVRLTGIARNTVREYKRRIEDQGLRLEDVVSMSDEAMAGVVQDETGKEIVRMISLQYFDTTTFVGTHLLIIISP